jgi:hypothetical protein
MKLLLIAAFLLASPCSCEGDNEVSEPADIASGTGSYESCMGACKHETTSKSNERLCIEGCIEIHKTCPPCECENAKEDPFAYPD